MGEPRNYGRWRELSRLDLIGDSEWHCYWCGSKLIETREESEYFDSVTGNPYKFVVRTCPKWTPRRWRWGLWPFDSNHLRGRLRTAPEENRRSDYRMARDG